jgi:D-psicose/D-tagatose/L-ribulose 3-epimerase
MIGRRQMLLGCAAPLLAKATARFAICSETFQGMTFVEACKAARRTGYSGIEIEPAHLNADPAALSASERRQIRRVMDNEGLRYVGLHSFLKAPAGLHLTTSDASVRRRSWQYFGRIIDLAADLGENPIMVLGSSKQRAVIDGVTPRTATERLKDGLHDLAPAAEERNVAILMEPLAPHLCNVVNTLAEAMGIVRAVNSPAIQTIFDTHNTAAEKQPVEALIREYLPWIRHVHLNEMDGRRPGAGGFPFFTVLQTLKQARYRYWMSVEVFDFQPDGETVARLANQYLQGVAAKLG